MHFTDPGSNKKKAGRQNQKTEFFLENSALSTLLTLALTIAGVTVLTGCRDPGPAEGIGQEIDEFMDDTADEVEDMIED